MNTLYYLRYNNYYNRIVKKYDTVADYLTNATVLATKTRINFNPGDGVMTTQVVNWDADNDNHPDYLLVADNTGEVLLSRWFIIESDRTSGTQYKQTLKRDTVVDNYDEVVTAPLFIEKAAVNSSDPAIYNKENMTFNQIKKSETMLKDASDCAWLVGYVARDYNEEVTFDIATYYDEEYSSLASYPYYNYNNKTIINVGTNGRNILYQYNLKITEPFGYSGTQVNYYQLTIASDKTISFKRLDRVPETYDTYPTTTYLATYIANIKPRVDATAFPELTSLYSPTGYAIVYPTMMNSLYSQRNKVIKVGDVYYRVIAEQTQETDVVYAYPDGINQASIYGATINGLTSTYAFPSQGDVKTSPLRFRLEQITQTNATQAKLSLNAPRMHCSDQPYDMFCMPYKDGMHFTDINIDVVSSKANNMTFATGLASLSGVVYDLQLLPYCPLINVPVTNVDLHDANTGDYQFITSTANPAVNLGVVLWCSRSQFTTNVSHIITIDDVKLANECDLYRLSSPNYNGVFEFNAAKNIQPGSNIAISYFKIDCAYKPFTPYIHIAPDFKGLYGADFNDARGLICSGDFSITSVTDKWAEYQINNKNYLASFDRQIESQELQNKWNRISDVSNIATMGANGGLIGGIKGGIAGVGLGAAAGFLDAGINLGANNELRRDALDLTKDQFGYQLGNIQALPNSLAKVSSINQNNKIFPFLEYYTCTDIEKEALKNKLKYNGMTIGRIGTISEFQKPEITYIKGKLIRIEGDLDYHEVNDLANELNQGLFI